MLRSCLVVLLCLLYQSHAIQILELKGDPDFRFIKLQWKANLVDEEKSGFSISYCEDQAWGKHRCKQKVVDNAIDVEVGRWKDHGLDFHLYETKLEGLRIATNYTVDVTPVVNGVLAPAPPRARALKGDLLIQTKEFKARAINCLANSSLVEIETGPYFGGRISVEGSTDERCSTQGDLSNARASYFIDVDHALCGSELTNTSVRTFIIVQENLPILTHSTRRFMVVCKYVPETFTVRAGVNLPDEPSDSPDYGNDLLPVGNDVFEVDPSELFDSTGTFFDSKLAKEVGKALKLSSEEGTEDSQKWAHLVLMIVLIVSAMVGISCAVFHFVKQSRRRITNGFIPPDSEQSPSELSVNLEGAASDFGEPQNGGTANPNASFRPPVPVTGVLDYSYDQNQTMTSSLGLDNEDPTTNCQTHFMPPDHVTTIKVDGPLSFHSFVQPVADDTNSISTSNDSLPSFIPANHCQAVSVNHLENIDAVFDEALNACPLREDELLSTRSLNQAGNGGPSKYSSSSDKQGINTSLDFFLDV